MGIYVACRFWSKSLYLYFFNILKRIPSYITGVILNECNLRGLKTWQCKISAPEKCQNRDMNKVLCNPTEGENNLFCEFSNPLNIPLFILKNKLYTSMFIHTQRLRLSKTTLAVCDSFRMLINLQKLEPKL